MNPKTRKVLEDLLNAFKAYRAPNPTIYEEAVKNAEKLLRPPVRFAWIRTPSGNYMTSAGMGYTVFRPPSGGWKAWSSDTTVHLGSYLRLAQAKQACVDHGVAHAEQRRAQNKAAQIHTAPHIRKALTVSDPEPRTVKYEGAIPETLKRWCDRHADRVEEVNRDDDGLWVYLRFPWWSPTMESHTIHEGSARDCLAELRSVEIEKKP